MTKRLLIALCAVGLMAGAAGVTTPAEAQIVVRVGPPRPPREVVPVAPHPGWVWQQGYHRWDGARYVWVPGAYAEPPRPRAHWVPGHWANRPGGYVWVEGHWR